MAIFDCFGKILIVDAHAEQNKEDLSYFGKKGLNLDIACTEAEVRPHFFPGNTDIVHIIERHEQKEGSFSASSKEIFLSVVDYSPIKLRCLIVTEKNIRFVHPPWFKGQLYLDDSFLNYTMKVREAIYRSLLRNMKSSNVSRIRIINECIIDRFELQVRREDRTYHLSVSELELLEILFDLDDLEVQLIDVHAVYYFGKRNYQLKSLRSRISNLFRKLSPVFPQVEFRGNQLNFRRDRTL